MDAATIRALNALNCRFYETVAADFDATRQRAWAGWERLIDLIGDVGAGFKPAPTRLVVLDAGCGNGRFGVWLVDRLGAANLRYVGIDSSAALLAKAREALTGLDAALIERDIIDAPPDDALGQFDLVALFGVLHHIPGAEQRRGLIARLAARVAPGGLFAFTEWRFLDDERLRGRIAAWDAAAPELAGQVEAGDYLLDWRRGDRDAPALRYCHAVDAAEHARLIAAAGLPVVLEYDADAANHYTVFRRM